MALLQRLGLGRHRVKQALLEERVNALQTALNRCKGVATRWRRTQWGLVTGVGIAMLAVGYVAGLYSQPVKPTITGVAAQPFASARPNDPEAAYSAYQKADYETALRLLRPLAEQRDPRAETTLGVMYDEGHGVPQDDAQALKWYRLAAEQGYAQAQFNLGVMYARGEADNGHQDNVSAHMWFNLAASRFPASEPMARSAAIKSRDAVASRMTPEEIAHAQQLARDWKPQQRQETEAQ
jgi:TPR repeat protein